MKDKIIWLEKVITGYYGERCPDFNKGCYCCKSWEFFDEIKDFITPTCDFEGKCKNKAFREVYPNLLGGKHKKRGWSYLCRKHFYSEFKRFKKIGKILPSSDVSKIDFERS